MVTAVLIGDRAGLDADTRRRLQAAGTYHVIAISGGNIAILTGVLLGVLRLAGAPARLAAAAVILCLLAYWQIVGSEQSVARATLVAVTLLAARALRPAHRSAQHAGVGRRLPGRGGAAGDRGRGVPADVRRHARHPRRRAAAAGDLARADRRPPAGAPGSSCGRWWGCSRRRSCAELALLADRRRGVLARDPRPDSC